MTEGITPDQLAANKAFSQKLKTLSEQGLCAETYPSDAFDDEAADYICELSANHDAVPDYSYHKSGDFQWVIHKEFIAKEADGHEIWDIWDEPISQTGPEA